MSKTSLGLIGGFIVVILIALIVSSQGGASLSSSLNPSSNLNGTTSTSTATNATGTASLPVIKDQMPAFTGIVKWLNTPDNQPLTAEQLKGKVVLVDFWTYSCINCIRTQPVLRKWHEMYAKDGLVIVGVHTPEFAFEKDVKNVEQAVKSANLLYPIAIDSDYGTWGAYNNQYWPAEYLFDRQGRLRHTHFGEGEYDKSEEAIRTLLAEGGTVTDAASHVDATPDFNHIVTNETYFGSARAANWDNPGKVTLNIDQTFKEHAPTLHHWNLGGIWMINEEFAQAQKVGDSFRMQVQADAMHIVLASVNGKPARVKVLIDGKAPTDEQKTTDMQQEGANSVITVTDSKLYHIARLPDAKPHTIELQILDSGVQFYAATFGQPKM